MTQEEARRQAVLALGGLEQIKENCRDRHGFPSLEAVIQDARFGLRILRKNASSTAVAALTLAAGIGATIVVFSVFDAVLIRSLFLCATQSSW